MIGQESNREKLKELIDNNQLSRFIIIIGEEGCGKKTLGRWLAKQLNAPFVPYDNKTDSVRQVIDLAYKQTSPIFYCIENYQSMNAAARNALLKVTEEPPNSAYIIMTTITDADLIDTLKSRSYMIRMDSYTEQEILEYCRVNNLPERLVKYSSVPGDVNSFNSIDYNKFETFVDNVWNNITKASMGNVLKLSSFFRIKESEVDNYDPKLFINAFFSKIVDRIHANTTSLEGLHNMVNCLTALSGAKRSLERSYAKQPIIDKLLLVLRANLYGIV